MRRFWAVTRATVLECLRSKFAVVFAALLAVCVLGVGLSFKGDGTLRGRIQTFLDYSTTLTQLLLGLLTLLLATFVTARDMRDKTVFTVASKPLSRPAYVAGRWLGIVLLDAVLLLAALAAIYALAQYLRSLPTAMERDKRVGRLPADAWDPDRQAVESEVFTARMMIKPDPFDVDELVQQQKQRLLEEADQEQLIRDQIRSRLALRDRRGTPDEAEVERQAGNPAIREEILSQIESHLRRRIVEELRLVQPGQQLPLIFSGVRPPAGRRELLKLRYKFYAIRRPQSGLVKSLWVAENPQKGRQFEWRDDPVDAASTWEIAPEAVTDDHRLLVFYQNGPENPTAVKILPDEITLLYRVGGFEANLAHAAALMLVRLMFLAACGVLFGVWMTFPVAALTCLIIFFLGCMGHFVQEATKLSPYSDRGVLDYTSYALARFAFFFMPNLPLVSSPADALRDGTVISWRVLAAEALTGTGLRALAGLVLGSLIFWRKELARVQV
ncbi:MAG: hypothetical protein AMJ81_04580 [Phycisphaerae bacterium SM23_33]|jgi:hypothetical protein|nr:MAG: hypothetical protein AMJ81_04580 [Phycisphaerae bacterium SM23_33]